MIDLYYFPSPNTWKVSIMLEECGLPYRIVPIDTLAGDQFKAEFLRISPNNKVPAIIDHDGDSGEVSLFESGAILLYLAEKTGKLLPPAGSARARALEWLFWQIGGLGPMAGQTHYFRRNAPENIQAVERFTSETTRLYRVMDSRLDGRDYLADTYSIADIACWGWVWFYDMHAQDLSAHPNVARWYASVGDRPAVIAGRKAGLDLVPAEHRGILERDDHGH
ncbi:glutathione S-transferase N-terminal domain-containing protein [Sphingosinicella soli]|uniref:GST-like protein n=1 Tax=Sphingosinicella soli TaxID=333708 RepID=A0A7W7B0T8_9SPHN|nr:GST-like protein [Sphingosinicella soli]